MTNFELLADEVVLYEGVVTSKNYKGNLQLTLTSHKIVLEKEKGVFKKEKIISHACQFSIEKSMEQFQKIIKETQEKLK